jgi:hypothetical protein
MFSLKGVSTNDQSMYHNITYELQLLSGLLSHSLIKPKFYITCQTFWRARSGNNTHTEVERC